VKRPNQARPRAKAHDCEGGPSLELLYRRHSHWLSTILRARYGDDRAEDLVQETYLRAASSQALALAQVRSPRALLLRIAINVAIDQHRRASVRSVFSGSEEDPDQQGAAAEQGEILALKQIVFSLPPRLQEVFALSRFAGLTYQEIAERLGLSVKTVEARMTKAVRTCAMHLT
jgi:RNA polymerase sigma-70 factor (ECF subfamily)